MEVLKIEDSDLNYERVESIGGERRYDEEIYTWNHARRNCAKR